MKNKLQGMIVIAVVLVLLSCNYQKKERLISVSNAKDLVGNRIDSDFDCGKLKNKTVPLMYKDTVFNVKEIDKELLVKLEGGEFSVKDEENQQSYLCGYFDVDECLILVYSETELNSVVSRLVLKELDNQGKVSSEFVLSEYVSYPDADIVTITYVQEDEFVKSIVYESLGDYDEDEDKYSIVVDSVSYVYLRQADNTFRQIKRDSVRNIK